MPTENFLSQNPNETKTKPKIALKKVLATVLRLPGIYFSEVLHPLGLKNEDIPNDYKNRDLADLGAGSGTRYYEITRLFKPKSYLGIDREQNEVKIGKMKLFNMKQLDFIQDDVRGDLGVAFGTHVSPEVINKLRDGFNNLVLGHYVTTKEEADTMAQTYKDKFGDQIEKVKICKRKPISLSMGVGYDVYFFIKSDGNLEDVRKTD